MFFAIIAGINFAFLLIFANRLFVKIFEGGVKNEECINYLYSNWIILDLLHYDIDFNILIYVYYGLGLNSAK